MKLDRVYVYWILDESVWSSWHEGHDGVHIERLSRYRAAPLLLSLFPLLRDALEDILNYIKVV